MKYTIKILLILSILFAIFGIEISYAENIAGLRLGKSLSQVDGSIGTTTTDIGMRIIEIVRYVFSGILVIVIVYFGARMIMSMGSNEENITSAKNGIWYSIVGIFFINFPIVIYNAIFNENSARKNLFINETFFLKLIEQAITFLEILVAGIAIAMLVVTGIRLITSRGREEKVSESKSKLLWVIIALVFIGFIEAYKNIIIAKGGTFKLTEATTIFSAGANLLLYIAGPVIMLFLTIAGYYYITSNGDEDRTKKGKSIIVNTIIGIVLLLCCYIVLNDISLLIH